MMLSAAAGANNIVIISLAIFHWLFRGLLMMQEEEKCRERPEDQPEFDDATSPAAHSGRQAFDMLVVISSGISSDDLKTAALQRLLDICTSSSSARVRNCNGHWLKSFPDKSVRVRCHAVGAQSLNAQTSSHSW